MRRLLQLRALRAGARRSRRERARPQRAGEGRASGEDREQRILEIIETTRSKRPRFKDTQITMSHGAGEGHPDDDRGAVRPRVRVKALAELGDAGGVEVDGVKLAMTTDTFVVKPIRFPGGSIGELAVNGTVNDLAAAGARASALSVAIVLEEGLDADVLRGEVEAIAEAAGAGVEVITGDTKVVERGHADEMYICTSGLGRVDERASLSTGSLAAGDRVLVSKPVGEHGTAIMLARGELGLDADVVSDTRSLGRSRTPCSTRPGPSCGACATRPAVASRRS